MPLYDYECQVCGHTEEHFVEPQEEVLTCSKCGAEAKRIFSAGHHHPNEDAEWIRSVLEVVDKEGGRAAQEFLKRPTRTNYQNWMKETGLRHLEPGEKPRRPQEPDLKRITREVADKDARRRRIEL
jgi:putative FmdB family regulatory protein